MHVKIRNFVRRARTEFKNLLEFILCITKISTEGAQTLTEAYGKKQQWWKWLVGGEGRYGGERITAPSFSFVNQLPSRTCFLGASLTAIGRWTVPEDRGVLEIRFAVGGRCRNGRSGEGRQWAI